MEIKETLGAKMTDWTGWVRGEGWLLIGTVHKIVTTQTYLAASCPSPNARPTVTPSSPHLKLNSLLPHPQPLRLPEFHQGIGGTFPVP